MSAAPAAPAAEPAPPAAAAPAPAPAAAAAVAVVAIAEVEKPAAPAAAAAPPPEDAVNAPKLSPLAIFVKFLGFGLRAFGGPVAQINMMREELVVKERWISALRFNRVLGVYQILPGPEATEMACYFGLLAGGRLGSVLGGLGFITPGFLLMLLFSYIYQTFGIANPVFSAIFSAVQPAVCAMVFRAAHKIGEAGTKDPKTKQFDWRLGMLGVMGAFQSVLNVNFFITKAHLALLYIAMKRDQRLLSWFLAIVPTAAYIVAIALKGPMEHLVPMGVGAAAQLGNTYASHFVVGLLGGLVTFGGAYTAVPFMQYEAVTSGGWMRNAVFLDSLAVGALLPTPMVMFVTMVGFVAGSQPGANLGPAGGLVGAILMTIGMFLPAFTFPTFFHEFFEGVASQRGVVADILDSMTATVVGLVAYTGCMLMRTSVTRPIDAIIFVVSLNVLYGLPHKYTPVAVVLGAALAGVVLFAPQ
jgi:putative chromate ion transporter